MAFSMHYQRNSWVIPACVMGISIVSLWSAKYWPVRISMDDQSGVTHTTQTERKSHCYRPPHTWMNELHFLNFEWRIFFFGCTKMLSLKILPWGLPKPKMWSYNFAAIESISHFKSYCEDLSLSHWCKAGVFGINRVCQTTGAKWHNPETAGSRISIPAQAITGGQLTVVEISSPGRERGGREGKKNSHRLLARMQASTPYQDLARFPRIHAEIVITHSNGKMFWQTWLEQCVSHKESGKIILFWIARKGGYF